MNDIEVFSLLIFNPYLLKNAFYKEIWNNNEFRSIWVLILSRKCSWPFNYLNCFWVYIITYIQFLCL